MCMQSIGKSPRHSCDISMLCVFACTNESAVSWISKFCTTYDYVTKLRSICRSTLYTYIFCLFYGIWQANFENAISSGIYCTGQSTKPFFSQQIWKIVFQAEDLAMDGWLHSSSTMYFSRQGSGCKMGDRFPLLFPPRLHDCSVVLAPVGFWTNGLRMVHCMTGERKRWLSWNLSVQYLVPGWDYGNEEYADLALQGTLPGVYTHTINATN